MTEAFRFTSTVEAGPGDDECCIAIPPEVCALLGWQEGDTLLWHIAAGGEVSVEKMTKHDALCSYHLEAMPSDCTCGLTKPRHLA